MNERFDVGAVDEIVQDIDRAKKKILYKLSFEGEEFLRREVPVITGRLQQSISGDVNESNFIAELSVSARSEAERRRPATLHLNDTKKRIMLRPVKSYNYAEVVALGNRRARIYPKRAQALLIPVPKRPQTGSFITSGGRVFIVRPSRRGIRPNRYDLRAAKKLKRRAPRVAARILAEAFR